MRIYAVFVPVVGALVIGVMARYGSERIRGHGIPEAIEAILINGSRVEPKVAILKPISSVVAGAAGGMSATFASPVAAVLLAVELLLFEWKPRSLIPVALASAVAAVLRRYLLGFGPLFPVPEIRTQMEKFGGDVLGKRLEEIMRPHTIEVYPDEPLRAAVYRMAEKGVTRMPVVERESRQLLGLISLDDLLKARTRHLEEERRRERTIQVQNYFPGNRSNRKPPEVEASA